MAYILFLEDTPICNGMIFCETMDDIQRYIEEISTASYAVTFDIPEFLDTTLCIEMDYDHMAEVIIFNKYNLQGTRRIVPLSLKNFIEVETSWKFKKVLPK